MPGTGWYSIASALRMLLDNRSFRPAPRHSNRQYPASDSGIWRSSTACSHSSGKNARDRRHETTSEATDSSAETALNRHRVRFQAVTREPLTRRICEERRLG